MRLLARLILPALIAPALIAVSSTPASADSGLKCTKWSGSYGGTCITINGTGRTVHDIIGDFVPPHTDYFHQTWAFTLTTYKASSCNPIGKPKSGSCAPAGTYRSRTRTGQPPLDSSACTEFGISGGGASISRTDCQNFGFARDSASMGDWPSFGGSFSGGHYTKTFASNTWVCVEVSWLVNGKWVNNGSGIHDSSGHVLGQRACAEVFS